MFIKKYTLLAIGLVSFGLYAQQNNDKEIKSIWEQVNALEKKSDKLNIYFNFQSSFDALKVENEDLETGFKARQLRLEIRGNLTDKLFYRFRHRLNRNNAARSQDNLAKATDMMYVGYHFTDKFNVIFGKQCQAWGGMEFDINPMNIYEYSDFIEYMDNFMLGINFNYKFAENQEVNLQITDSRNDKFSDIYGNLSAQNIYESKSPLTYILNWNGSFFNNQLQTRWAYGVQTEAKNTYSKMITIGNKLNLKQFQLAFDYMRANEDLDRLGIATAAGATYLSSIGESFFEDVSYNTFILKAEFQPDEKWNVFAKGLYETTSVKDVPNFDDNFRKSYGYFAGVEYIPFSDQDLRLFLIYVGRKYDFNPASGNADYNTNRVSLGMVYRIKAF